jgi:hypothetical protein
MAQICHIKGEKVGAARHDAAQTDDERRAFENLILMCANHHKVIDTAVKKWPVEALISLKSEHEKGTSVPEPSPEVVQELLALLNTTGFSVAATLNQTGSEVHQQTVGHHGASHSVSFHGPVHGQVAVGDYNIQHQTILSGPAPRELTADDLTTIADKLSRFRGLSVNIFSYNSGGREVVKFALQLQSLLKAAGWAVTPVHGTEQGEPRSDRPVPGLLVEVGPQRAAPKQIEAATALVEELRSRRITTDGPIAFNSWARGGIDVQGTEDPGAAVQVTIGPVY